MQNPLNQTDIRALRKAVSILPEVLQQIERAERAGVDMSALRALHDEIREHSSQLMREYATIQAGE